MPMEATTDTHEATIGWVRPNYYEVKVCGKCTVHSDLQQRQSHRGFTPRSCPAVAVGVQRLYRCDRSLPTAMSSSEKQPTEPSDTLIPNPQDNVKPLNYLDQFRVSLHSPCTICILTRHRDAV